MLVSMADAPAQWFKAFAELGVDVSAGGEFDANKAANALSRELDVASGKFMIEDKSERSSGCWICYKGVCVYCKTSVA